MILQLLVVAISAAAFAVLGVALAQITEEDRSRSRVVVGLFAFVGAFIPLYILSVFHTLEYLLS